MGNISQLPAGFKLDQQPTSELPEGFQLDAPQFQSESEIPVFEEIGLPFAPKEPQQEFGIGDKILGGLETAKALVTGATTGTLGFLGGTAKQLVEELVSGEFGTPEAANRIEASALRHSEQLTDTPDTELGKRFTSKVGEVLAPLAAVAPQLTPGLVPLRQASIRSASQQLPKLPKLSITDAPPVRNKQALKTLGGDIESAKAVNVIEQMSSKGKEQVGKMLDGISKARRGDSDARPSDVVGNAAANRAKDIARINTTASTKIGNVVKSQAKKSVDLSTPRDNFLNSMQDLGVTFSRAEDGWITPDFSRSKFKGGDKQQMTVLINDLAKGKIGFSSAHDMKRSIRENLNFDSLGKGKVVGDSAKVLRDLSSQINDVLTTKSKPYAKANAEFAKTVKLKEMFQKMAGKEIDIFIEGEAASALGDKVKRMTSNATSRTEITKTINNADKILKEFGITYGDDVAELSRAANHLERIFKIAPPNSLKGIASDVASGVVQGDSALRTAAKIVPRIFSKSEQATHNKTMATLRNLIKETK